MRICANAKSQSASLDLILPRNEKQTDEIEMTEQRVPFSVKVEDERRIMREQPKNFDFIVERSAERI